MFAYHAFANVLLFHRMARANGLSDEPGLYNDQKMQELRQQLETLEQALHITKALTPLGRALCEPLYHRIREVN